MEPRLGPPFFVDTDGVVRLIHTGSHVGQNC